MKTVLAGAAILALTMTFGPSTAGAGHPGQWVEQYIGQDVYNLKNTCVGRLQAYIDVRGTPGAIIANDSPRGRTIVVRVENVGKRDAGGLLLAMSDTGVALLPTYQPGRLPYF